MSGFEIVEGDIQPPNVGSANPLHSPWDTYMLHVASVHLLYLLNELAGVLYRSHQCRLEGGNLEKANAAASMGWQQTEMGI